VASEHRYQLEVLEKALKENIILYLETGGGKTLIAVLLMKSLAHNLRLKGDKRIAVFLVPTVFLVHQVRLFTTVFVEKPWQWCDVCSDLI
jgi:ERCC4-related helicase